MTTRYGLEKKRLHRGRFAVATAAAVVAATTLAACGSSGGKVSKDGLSGNITIPSVIELTGAAGPAGRTVVDGQKTAIKEINDSHFLGSARLALKISDTAGDPTQGASLVNRAARTDTPAVLGAIISGVAVAEAPVAQRSGVPYVQFSVGGNTQKTGKWTWSMSPNLDDAMHWETDYLKSKGAHKIGIIYNSDNPANSGFHKKIKQLAPGAGLQVVAQQAVTLTQADTSSAVAKILAAHPDAVIVLAPGSPNVQLVSQIRQSGFNGEIMGGIGMAAGVLKTLGKAGQGVKWATYFTPLLKSQKVNSFSKNYEAIAKTPPTNFAASGYDAVWFLARALKAANSTDRSKVLAAMNSLAQSGFPALTGTDEKLTLTGRTAETKGFLINWDGTQEAPVPGFGN